MNVHQALARFGADTASLHLFESDAPDLLPYATLLTARTRGNRDLAAVDGVYEWQGAPLLYLAGAELLNGDRDRLARVRRLLAMRGDSPYLGVVSPGRLEIYRIALDNWQPEQARVSLGLSEGQEFATLAFLGNNRPGIGSRAPWISQVVLNLLSRAIDGLKEHSRVSGDDAISLVGRALFTRFLADREMLPALPHNASDLLLELLTSVVNGAELRQTKVWPEISAPFCILFARNQLPSEGSGFRLVTPRLEQSLNRSGNMRIDSAGAEIVTPRQERRRQQLSENCCHQTICPDLTVQTILKSLSLCWRASSLEMAL